MSVLYLDGVKLGDTQMTISGLSVAMFFLFVSKAQPCDRLSAERPVKRLFTWHMMLSLLGQFAIHMATLLTAVAASRPHTPNDAETRSPDAKFAPNVLNTVVFLVSTAQTAVTFGANYRGKPFMQSLNDNTPLKKALAITWIGCCVCAAEIYTPLNDWLELHALPEQGFKQELLALLFADLVGTVAFTRLLNKIFRPKIVKRKQISSSTTLSANGKSKAA
jgi:manganese-transporting P-type ATPase